MCIHSCTYHENIVKMFKQKPRSSSLLLSLTFEESSPNLLNIPYKQLSYFSLFSFPLHTQYIHLFQTLFPFSL
ncbi:hypothetical protein HanRHA438_Chr17g0804361 [Helianthus annuus]|nr:hypothetical protein HanRHA438_Chr17g0804361 [Helianthus annuus]